MSAYRAGRCCVRCDHNPPVPRAGLGTVKVIPVEVMADRAATYPIVLDELLSAPSHRTERYATTVSRPTMAGDLDVIACALAAGRAYLGLVCDPDFGPAEEATWTRAGGVLTCRGTSPRRPSWAEL